MREAFIFGTDAVRDDARQSYFNKTIFFVSAKFVALIL